jgi:hypothetical protein
MKVKLLVLAALAAAVATLAATPVAQAGDTTCIGTLVGTHDNVVVPSGATCVLNGTQVRGNVKALPNSRLQVNSANIRGDLDGDQADYVQIVSSTIGGNVSLIGGGPATGVLPPGGFFCTVVGNLCEASVLGTTVMGNVHIEKVTGSVRVGSVLIPAFGFPVPNGNVQVYDNNITAGDDLVVAFNTVRQNIQVYKNRGPGSKTVTQNTADTIQCFENMLPFVGGPNGTAKKQGQCF